jgi:Xaa-Pro aminopeptidase
LSNPKGDTGVTDLDHDARSASFVNWAVLRREMDRLRLDAIVAATPEGTFYLSGIHIELNRWFRDRLALVVIPRNKPAIFIVCNIEEPLARAVGWIEDIRTYAHYPESVGALAEVLKEQGLDRGRVGFEERFWSTAFHRRVSDALPHISLVGAEEVIDRTRTLKMPAEVALLREAALLSDDAAHAAWTSCRKGTTEHDLAVAVALEILERGAQRVAHLTLGSGTNTRIVRNRPGDRKLEQGDLVVSEFGALHEAYWADLGRMGVVGAPSTRQREHYKLLRDVQRATIARMKPGVRCGELYTFARDAYLHGGVDHVLPDIGHSMPRGRSPEPPVLQGLDKTPLEANMVFAVGPSFIVGSDRYSMKDLVAVTDSDPVILSDRWDTSELFIFK